VGTSSSSAPAPASSLSPPSNDDDDDHASSSAAAAAAAFATSLADWPLFPDTTPALAKLSSALGLKLVVLSNVDRASFAHTRAALEQGFAFAAAFTAEEIGSYKLRFPSIFFNI
jgi:FMN phosphatase YigB (HAD superfamily)